MMRKDVKLGFAIGGVLLAVLVVYVLVGTGSSSNSGDANRGAGIVTEDTSGKPPVSPKTGEQSAELNSPKIGGGSDPSKIGNSNSPGMIAGNSAGSLTTGGPPSAPSANSLASANPKDAAKPRDPNNDLWNSALNDGQLLISKTPDVPGGRERDANATGNQGNTGSAAAPAPAPAPAQASLANGTTDVKGTSSNTGTLDTSATGSSAPRGNRFSNIDRIGTGMGSGPSTQPSSTDERASSSKRSNAGNNGGASSSSASGSSGSAGQREHVVQRYETLSSISQMAYGSPNYYPAILRANPNLDPKKLKPGMTIILPAMSEVKPDAQPAGATIAGNDSARGNATIDSKTEYRVQANDSLYRIAMKLYGKPEMAARLYDANKDTIGADPAKLKLNMILKLPEPPTQSASR